LNQFFHLFDNWMHAHPHYIFLQVFQHKDFRLTLVHTKESFGQNVVCFNTYLHFLPYSNNQPYLCFPSLINGVHIVGHVSNVVPTFLCL
jgi:hypothetical protein